MLWDADRRRCASTVRGSVAMAKGQKKSTKEIRKPKKEKAKAGIAPLPGAKKPGSMGV